MKHYYILTFIIYSQREKFSFEKGVNFKKEIEMRLTSILKPQPKKLNRMLISTKCHA